MVPLYYCYISFLLKIHRIFFLSVKKYRSNLLFFMECLTYCRVGHIPETKTPHGSATCPARGEIGKTAAPHPRPWSRSCRSLGPRSQENSRCRGQIQEQGALQRLIRAAGAPSELGVEVCVAPCGHYARRRRRPLSVEAF